jgi:hypothetical protein
MNNKINKKNPKLTIVQKKRINVLKDTDDSDGIKKTNNYEIKNSENKFEENQNLKNSLKKREMENRELKLSNEENLSKIVTKKIILRKN